MRGAGGRDDLPTLRVTNISEDTQENDLRELFGVFGRVARVYVGRDRETGQGKGFAFVSFEDRAIAQRAMEKVNGKGYDNLILSVQWSRECCRLFVVGRMLMFAQSQDPNSVEGSEDFYRLVLCVRLCLYLEPAGPYAMCSLATSFGLCGDVHLVKSTIFSIARTSIPLYHVSHAMHWLVSLCVALDARPRFSF